MSTSNDRPRWPTIDGSMISAGTINSSMIAARRIVSERYSAQLIALVSIWCHRAIRWMRRARRAEELLGQTVSHLEAFHVPIHTIVVDAADYDTIEAECKRLREENRELRDAIDEAAYRMKSAFDALSPRMTWDKKDRVASELWFGMEDAEAAIDKADSLADQPTEDEQVCEWRQVRIVVLGEDDPDSPEIDVCVPMCPESEQIAMRPPGDGEEFCRFCGGRIKLVTGEQG